MSNYSDEHCILETFQDDMWYMFHDGTIDSEEDFRREFNEWISGATIYRQDCKNIVNAIDDIYLFNKHDIFGRPKGWEQAAYNALYDLLMAKGMTWEEMKAEIDKEEKEAWDIDHGQRTNLTVMDKTHGRVHVFKNIRESKIHDLLKDFDGNSIEWMTARGEYFKLEIDDKTGV